MEKGADFWPSRSEVVDSSSDNREAVDFATEIYEQFGGMIYAFIKYHRARKEDVDDIFQDFFLTLLKNPVNPKEVKIEPFLYRSTRNDVYDYARRKKTREKHIKHYYDMFVNEPDQKTPEENMETAEEAQKMLEFIKKTLPKSESNVIIKRHYEDNNNNDIARQMGLSKRTISHYLCTGLKKIRKFVKTV